MPLLDHRANTIAPALLVLPRRSSAISHANSMPCSHRRRKRSERNDPGRVAEHLRKRFPTQRAVRFSADDNAIQLMHYVQGKRLGMAGGDLPFLRASCGALAALSAFVKTPWMATDYRVRATKTIEGFERRDRAGPKAGTGTLFLSQRPSSSRARSVLDQEILPKQRQTPEQHNFAG